MMLIDEVKRLAVEFKIIKHCDLIISNDLELGEKKNVFSLIFNKRLKTCVFELTNNK